MYISSQKIKDHNLLLIGIHSTPNSICIYVHYNLLERRTEVSVPDTSHSSFLFSIFPLAYHLLMSAKNATISLSARSVSDA